MEERDATRTRPLVLIIRLTEPGGDPLHHAANHPADETEQECEGGAVLHHDPRQVQRP